MGATIFDLDSQAAARVFPFGGTGSSQEGLVTIYKGTAASSTVVLDVKGSQTIGGNLTVTGNITFGGTIDETTVTNMAIADINMTLNKGGSTASAAGAGLFIEGDSAAVIGKLLFDNSLTSKWKIGDGSTQVEVTTISGTQTLTNKSISGSQISSAVALATTVTTNANLTGPITSSGNATSIAAQTGTGTTFVMNTSPTLVTPVIGVATGTSLDVTTSLSTGTASSADGILVFKNTTNAFTQTFKASNPGASITYVLPTTAPTAGQVLTATAPSSAISTLSWSTPGGGGTVTAIGVTTANGVSGSSSGGSTPNLTITLGAIVPTTVNGVTLSGSSTPTLAVTGTSTISGTNTGDQTTITGNSATTTATAITDDTTTNATMYPTWVTAATGNLPQKVSSTKLSFNPSTGTLTATQFVGGGAGITGLKYFREVTITGTQDSSNKVFTLSSALVGDAGLISWTGQVLKSGSSNDYVISGTTLTFQAARSAPLASTVLQGWGYY